MPELDYWARQGKIQKQGRKKPKEAVESYLESVYKRSDRLFSMENNASKTWTRKVSTRGRVCIPREILRILKPKEGQKLTFKLDGNGIIIKFV
ncbi:Uncharacterised protein [Candidatus Anstonella stagnisolia]|nr:Uncharacterised protein [Candidatus Anstonella stagnisolia]